MSSQEDSLVSLFPTQENGGGQTDDRYLWHEMLRVIDQVRPMWVIGENVNGITTMVESFEITEVGSESSLFNEGNGVHGYRSEQTFTIERICRDLESKGYSVQPMLIPAAAVGAPHRRDRIFILAYNVADSDCSYDLRESGEYESKSSEEGVSKRNEVRKPGESNHVRSEIGTSTENTMCDGCRCRQEEKQGNEWVEWDISAGNGKRLHSQERAEHPSDSDCNRGNEVHKHIQSEVADGAESISNGRIGDVWRLLPGERWKGFPTVSPVHRGNDGLPFDVDNLTIPFGKWRAESLKAYGNAIVPQVIYQIMKVINDITNN